MKTLFPLLALTLALMAPAMAADPTPEELLAQGVALLKEEKLVEAVKVLALASEAFGKAGNDEKAAEANSMLYWSKKRMTLDQANELAGTPAPRVLETVERVVEAKVDPAQAKVWLVRANDYARRTDDPLLKAIRYFEVAERFKGTPEGFSALDLSLKAMKEVAAAPKAGPNGAVGKAARGDGRLYVQSKPAGAQVLVMQDGELRDTGVKTPALVQLPVGRAELVLRLPKHDEARLSAEVTAQVSKPEPVLLRAERFDLDVVADPGLGEGWSVFVDGKPAFDKSGKPAVAPCTVMVPEGTRSVQLAKEGFADPAAVRVTVKAGENAPVTVKGQARAGQSRALAAMDSSKVEFKVFANKGWQTSPVSVQSGQVLRLSASGQVTLQKFEVDSKWPLADADGLKKNERFEFEGIQTGWGKLIVRVGKTVYEAGTSASIQIRDQGKVEFRVVDKGSLDNNDGFFIVKISTF